MAAQAGADLGDLMAMMGHARNKMTLRYRGFLPNRSKSIIETMRGGATL